MYKNQLIAPEEIKKYGALIPEFYHERIKNEELFAIATFEQGIFGKFLVGVVIMGVRESWAEILWFELTDMYDDTDRAEDLIRERVWDAMYGREAKGIFAELPLSFGKDRLISIFSALDFRIEETVSNVMEFTVGSIQTDKLPALKSSKGIVALKNADSRVLLELGNMMAKDERNIPVEIPVRWEDYDQKLSLVHTEDDAPAGVILVTSQKGAACVELAYENTPKGILKLVSALVIIAKGRLDPETKVTVPIVEHQLFDVVKMIAPDAKRAELIKAYRMFEKEERISPFKDYISE